MKTFGRRLNPERKVKATDFDKNNRNFKLVGEPEALLDIKKTASDRLQRTHQ